MLRLFWFILFHLLGLACIAADVAIIGSIGLFGVEWTGWLAIGFYWWVAVGVAMGWKRFVGRPVTLVILGFYMLASLLLLGLSFSQKLGGASLLLAFAPLATALVGRIILDIVLHARKPKAEGTPAAANTPAPAKSGSLHDSLF
jgi:hypothetical protein